MTIEIPSDQEVVTALTSLGDRVSARKLCSALVDRGYPLRQSQIAMQRAAERGRILINEDWTLSLPREVVAA